MEEADPILDLAVEYVLHGRYAQDLTKEKKRAVRKRAAKLVIERGEVFLQKKNQKASILIHRI